MTRIKNGRRKVIAENLPCPPCNVGPRSTPDYPALSRRAVRTLPGGRKVFAGQRADAFHVDLGSIFDLGALRPFNEAHLISMPNMNGVNAVQSFNVHTIALQVPISEISRYGNVPTNPMSPGAVIGVWATAARRKSRIWNAEQGRYVGTGPWKQVSRLGNPLVNEVLIPMAEKDEWNALPPYKDSRFAKYVNRPELAGLLPVLYPGVFPNLAAYNKPRADLNAILHTGIPAGVVPGFQNFTGPTQADMLRLNVAIPPSENPHKLGLVAGDPAGFPNGRRIDDDVVTIELRAVAGLTIPLVDPSFTPDGAASAIEDGTTNSNAPVLKSFPYLGIQAAATRRSPGPRRRHEHRASREPLCRAGLRHARHRGRRRRPRRHDAGGNGGRRGGDQAAGRHATQHGQPPRTTMRLATHTTRTSRWSTGPSRTGGCRPSSFRSWSRAATSCTRRRRTTCA